MHTIFNLSSEGYEFPDFISLAQQKHLLWDMTRPWSEAGDIVITGIFLTNQNIRDKGNRCVKESYVRIIFRDSSLYDITNSVIEILWSQSAAARVGSNTTLVLITICAGVGKQLHTLPSHPTRVEPRGFSWGTLTSKQKTYLLQHEFKGGFIAGCGGNVLYLLLVLENLSNRLKTSVYEFLIKKKKEEKQL